MVLFKAEAFGFCGKALENVTAFLVLKGFYQSSLIYALLYQIGFDVSFVWPQLTVWDDTLGCFSKAHSIRLHYEGMFV